MLKPEGFQYHPNSFFNDVDVFVFFDYTWRDGKIFESKCHLHNGFWYTNESLKYKCTSIRAYKK